MNNPVKVGIIGASNIAKQHLRVINSIDGMDCVAITSRTRDKAELIASEYGIEHVVSNMEEMVHGVKPDALLVLVSASAVYEVTMDALEYGIPVFSEKPAGLTLLESKALADKSKDAGVHTMVGYNRRYYSNFHEGLSIINEYGPLMGLKVEGHERINLVRERGKHPVNVLEGWVYANATHTIDLLRFFGGEPEELHCVSAKYREPGGDQFAAVMRFQSGVIGEYNAHWLSPGGWSVTLYGNGVTVEFKPLENGTWVNRDGESGSIELSHEDSEYKPGFYGQMVAFRDLVAGKNADWQHQSLSDAHKTMEIAQEMLNAVVDRTEAMPR